MNKLAWNRRFLLLDSAGVGASVLFGVSGHAQQQAPVYDLRVGRDTGCGCCHAWAEGMRRSGRFRTTLNDEPDMAALTRRLGVPDDFVVFAFERNGARRAFATHG